MAIKLIYLFKLPINHIIKSEFFIIYLTAHNTIFIEKNIKRIFKRIGILF